MHSGQKGHRDLGTQQWLLGLKHNIHMCKGHWEGHLTTPPPPVRECIHMSRQTDQPVYIPGSQWLSLQAMRYKQRGQGDK